MRKHFFFLVQDQIYLEQFKTTQNDYDDIGFETTETLTYFHGRHKGRILKRCGFYSH